VKNSWISSGARRFVCLSLTALLALSSVLGAKKKQVLEDLINLNLGPEYAQWLGGAIARIATPEEIEAYLELSDDDAAESFIEEFWARRAEPERAWPQQNPRDVFERRAEEADRRFTQAARLGRRTARGRTHVLYGPPAEISWETEKGRSQVPIEVWTYGKGAEPGLDGSRPEIRYYFVSRRGVMEFHSPKRPLSRFDEPLGDF
jgi:GWxTD domain-containing protein